MKEKIILIGAGAWGTAIANLIADNKKNICAISDINEVAEEINKNHTNSAFLPNIILEKNLYASTNLEQEIIDADYVFIVVPSNAVLPILKQISQLKIKKNCGFIFATKGLEHSSLKFFHEIFEEILPNKNFAILSGPNFAIEVAAKIPSITNIASKNQEFANEIIAILKNHYFKPIYTKEVLACEISAIIKNIMAIACGICDGLKLGENSKAALIIQGIEEIKLLAKSYGQNSINLDNGAGFGDIFLTCSTSKSRNNSLGFAIGNGEKYQVLLSKKTYEGAINAKSINELAKKFNIKLPLCQTIYEILQNQFEISEIKEKIIKIFIN